MIFSNSKNILFPRIIQIFGCSQERYHYTTALTKNKDWGYGSFVTDKIYVSSERYMGPEEGECRPAVPSVLLDPRGRHAGARVAGARDHRAHGLPQHGLDSGEKDLGPHILVPILFI